MGAHLMRREGGPPAPAHPAQPAPQLAAVPARLPAGRAHHLVAGRRWLRFGLRGQLGEQPGAYEGVGVRHTLREPRGQRLDELRLTRAPREPLGGLPSSAAHSPADRVSRASIRPSRASKL